MAGQSVVGQLWAEHEDQLTLDQIVEA